jgi:hypothetical protein
VTSITSSIAALTGEEAIRVPTADYQDRLPDPAGLRALKTGLREAITDDAGLAGYAQPGTIADADGLARATLLHLAATRPDLVPVITGPSTTPATPSASRSASPSARWWSWRCRPRSN